MASLKNKKIERKGISIWPLVGAIYCPIIFAPPIWLTYYIWFNKRKNYQIYEMTYMYGIAVTYGVVSLLLLGGFAYITFKMTSKR